MAALYVLAMFHRQSTNVLGYPSFRSRTQSLTPAVLLHSALDRTLAATTGHYDLLLRFLCGLLSPDCHHGQLSGFLFPRKVPRITGLQDAWRLLENSMTQPRHREQLDNLQECLREMVLEES